MSAAWLQWTNTEPAFRALPADVLSPGNFTDPEQNMINSMESDDDGAQFNNDVFGPDF
jgi:hypothetical protein